jgi:hypothetical protein
MRARVMGVRVPALTAALLAGTLIGGTIIAPAAAAATSRPAAASGTAAAAQTASGLSAMDTPPSTDGLTADQAAAEASASQQARATGKPVVVDALTTSYSTTTADSSGAFTFDESVLPQRVQRNGAWVPIDTTLTRDADGGYSPAATLNTLTISGGGGAPLATMADGSDSLSVAWPAPLPAPSVSGATATYRNALPGVDLQVTATVYGGFAEVLVVRDAAAAADPGLARLAFPITAQGVTPRLDAAGDLTATDVSGAAVFVAAAPSMWDSNTRMPTSAAKRVTADRSTAAGPGLAAVQGRLGVQLSGGTMTLTPDQAMLTGAGTQYPVYISPTFTPDTAPSPPSHAATGPKQDFDEVKQGSPCNGVSLYNNTGSAGDDGQLGVGYDDFAGGCEGTMRAYYQLQIPSQIYAPNSTIISADLNASVPYAAANGTNSGNTVYVRWVSPINSGTDWNNQPGAGTTVTSASFTTTSNFPNTAVGFNVKTQIQDAANGKWANWTVGLRDKYETSNDIDFVRFADNPHLSIEYDHTPNAAAKSTLTATSGTDSIPCVTSGTLPWMGKTASVTPPTLTASATDPDGDSVAVNFYYLKAGGTAASLQSAVVKSGAPASVTVPESFISGLGTTSTTTIEYYTTVTDGRLTSGESVVCEFNYDPATPAAPTVSSATYPPVVSGTGPAAGTPGSFTLTAASGETVADFVYRLDSVPPTGTGDCTGTYSTPAASDAATVSLTAPSPGVHTLYVYSCDTAGNISDSTAYQFAATNDPNTQFADLSDAFNNIAISTSTTESGAANADGGGNSLPESQLTAQGWTSGGTLQVDGATLTLPKFGTGAKDNVLAVNQTIDVGQSGGALVFLAFADNAGNASPDYSQYPADDTAPVVPPGAPVAGIDCTVTDSAPTDCVEPTGQLTYTDSSGNTSTHPYYLNAPDWVKGPQSLAVTSLAGRATSTTVSTTTTTRVYAFAVPLDPAETLTSVTLPDVSNAASGPVPGLHILAMGVRDDTTAGAPSGDTWAGAWSSPIETGFGPASGDWNDETVRTVVDPSVSGNTVRITLSNAQGTVPLTIGAASIAPQSSGAAAAAAPVPLTFGAGDSPGVTIPGGAQATSNPLTLTAASSFSSLTAGSPVLVSLQITNASLATVPGDHTWGAASYATASGSGNHTGDTAATSFTTSLGSLSYVLTGMDIAESAGTPTLAVLGDDVAAGSPAAPVNGIPRLSDLLAQAGTGYGVLEEGIENNQVGLSYTDTGASSLTRGYSVIARLDRDVLDQPGLTTVIVDEGLYDLLAGSDDVTLLTDYAELVTQLNAWGVNVIIGTLTPCTGFSLCTATVDGYRTSVNGALSDNFTNTLTPYADAVDFDATVATTNSSGSEVLVSAADAGDHVNLAEPGYQDLLNALDENGTTITALLDDLN